MPYTVAANSIVQVTTRSSLFGQTVMNTWTWRWLAGGTPITDGASALDDFEALLEANGWRDSYQAMLPSQCLNGFADIQWIYPTRFRKRTYVFFPSGNAVANTTISNCAAAMEFTADVATRRAQSVKHIPGMGGENSVTGLLDPVTLGTMDDFIALHLITLTFAGGQLQPVIYGRARPSYTDRHGVVHPALPVSTLPITGGAPQPTLRVMRRRTVGVGI